MRYITIGEDKLEALRSIGAESAGRVVMALLETAMGCKPLPMTGAEMAVYLLMRDNKPPVKPPEEETASFEEIEYWQDVYARAQSVLDAAQSAGFPRNDRTFDQLVELVKKYPVEDVLRGIDECVKYGKVSLAYLSRILENWSKSNEAPTLHVQPTTGVAQGQIQGMRSLLERLGD